MRTAVMRGPTPAQPVGGSSGAACPGLLQAADAGAAAHVHEACAEQRCATCILTRHQLVASMRLLMKGVQHQIEASQAVCSCRWGATPLNEAALVWLHACCPHTAACRDPHPAGCIACQVLCGPVPTMACNVHAAAVCPSPDCSSMTCATGSAKRCAREARACTAACCIWRLGRAKMLTRLWAPPAGAPRSMWKCTTGSLPGGVEGIACRGADSRVSGVCRAVDGIRASVGATCIGVVARQACSYSRQSPGPSSAALTITCTPSCSVRALAEGAVSLGAA